MSIQNLQNTNTSTAKLQPKATNPWLELAKESLTSDYLYIRPISTVSNSGRFEITRYEFWGPQGGGEKWIKIGIFGGFYGDEPESSEAILRLLQLLLKNPEIAKGYQIYAYPAVNPHALATKGRTTGAGNDLLKELWKESDEAEPYLLERELAVVQFDGVISLRSDPSLDKIHGLVKSHTLRDQILLPALQASEGFLHPATSRSEASSPLHDWRNGLLTNPHQLPKPNPFEITLGLPQGGEALPRKLAVEAVFTSILQGYRQFLAQAHHI